MSADPRDNVPRKLREDVAEAEAAHKQQLGNGGLPPESASAAPPEKPPQEPTAAAAVDPHAAPELPPESPLSTPESSPEASEPPPTDPGAEVARLRQANQVLRAKYNAEVPRLHHDLRTRDDRIAALEQKVQALEAVPATPPGGASGDANPSETPEPTDPREAYGLTEDELEYGNGAISLAEKIAKQMNAKLQAKVERLEQQYGAVDKQVQTVGQRSLEKELTALRPNWAEVNNSDAFKAFCATVEPLSGQTYDDLLQRAVSENDVMRIDSVFERFESTPPAARASGTGPAKPGTPTTIDAQVEPRSPGSPENPGSTAGKRVYTEAEYLRLTDELNKGRYRGERAEKLRKELDAAFLENRIKGM